MKCSTWLLFALCGLLWPTAAAASATYPNLSLRCSYNFSGRDTLFVDWSTVYAKTRIPSTVQNSNYAVEPGIQPDEYQIEIFDIAVLGTGTALTMESLVTDRTASTHEYRLNDASVRRDTFLTTLDFEKTYVLTMRALFFDPTAALDAVGRTVLSWGARPIASKVFPITLSANPAFVREDAGATPIEIKAQMPPNTFTASDIHVRLVATDLNGYFHLDTSNFVIEEGSNSATGQVTLTPNPTFLSGDQMIFIEARQSIDIDFQSAIIWLLDTDKPTTEIELTFSDPVISTDGRATDVTVTGTLNGALLNKEVSFSLQVMPTSTAARDTDFGIQLATLTIPAGQATGTATVRVTPRNQNGGQIWLGVAEHPTIEPVPDTQIIVIVKEAAIELTERPSGFIDLEATPQIIREDAGQINVDLKVSLKDASPVDETVSFEIVDHNAQRETDYFAELSPLTIPAGQKEATATLSLEIVDNSTTEEVFRTFWVKATLGNSTESHPISIADDESAATSIILSASPTEIAEDSGQTTITVTGTLIGSALSEPLTIDLSHATSSAAVRDVDYTADFEPLTIPAGQTTGTATLTITPTPNDGKEKDEDVIIAPVEKVKITEDGQEREILVDSIEITLKDVADAPAVTTPTDPTPSSLAFDAPASTVLSGTVNEALSVVLPTAQSDPEGELTYRVFNLPAEFTFDATTRTITGTPTTAGQTSIEYYALSEDLSPAMLTYTIDIQEKSVVPVELRGIAATPQSIREDADEAGAITLTISLKKAAKQDAVIALAIVSPTEGKTAKLNEDFTATLPATITIPTGKTKGTAELTLLPKDNTTADGNKALAVQATSPSGHQALINIQIIDNETASTTASADDDSATPDSDEDGGQTEDGGEGSEDAFTFASTVGDQAYTAGTEITALVLPEATGGEGAITYRVFGLPAGLEFDAATHTISGTPTAATEGAVEVTYLAQDSAGTGITLAFSITVNSALNFGDLFDLSGAGGG